MAVGWLKPINMICREITATSGDIPGWIYIDTTRYSGTVSYYLEVVAKISSGSNSVYLHNSSDTVRGTVTVSATSYTRYRSSAMTISTGVFHLNIASSTISVKAARVIIIQSHASAITDTATQIEIGDYEASKSFAASATDYPLVYPKYWYLDSTKFDGGVTFEASITWMQLNDKGTITFKLQKDDGSFGSWSDVCTIYSGTGTKDVVRHDRYTTDFSASLTTGRNYRLVVRVDNYKYGSINIYNAKVIVKQTDASAITKTETILTLLNSDSAVTGLQKCPGYYDADEFAGVTVNIYPEHDASASGSNTKLVEPYTIIDSWPSSNSNQAMNSGGVTAVGQSFTGNGAYVNCATFKLKLASGSPSGNIYAKVYNHSGTFGTSSVPTGAAEATSDPIDASIITATYVLYTFTFSTPYLTVNGTKYVISVEYAGTDPVQAQYDNAGSHGGNLSTYSGSWTAYSTYDLQFYINVYGGADVANSSVTGASRQRGGTALSITDDKNIDTYVIAATIYHHKLIYQATVSGEPPTVSIPVLMYDYRRLRL